MRNKRKIEKVISELGSKKSKVLNEESQKILSVSKEIPQILDVTHNTKVQKDVEKEYNDI
jgi:hypothetical protein